MRLWIAALCSLLCSLQAIAGTLSAPEVAKLKSDITTMMAAFEKGDADLLIANTHESVYALMGGKEVFEKSSREAVQQLLQMGVKFVSSEMGTPTQTYAAGDEEMCFVPRISVMEVQGRKAKSTGFMIAVRSKDSSVWKYLDGAPLRKNPELLRYLFPKLTSDPELPQNTVELVQ